MRIHSLALTHPRIYSVIARLPPAHTSHVSASHRTAQARSGSLDCLPHAHAYDYSSPTFAPAHAPRYPINRSVHHAPHPTGVCNYAPPLRSQSQPTASPVLSPRISLCLCFTPSSCSALAHRTSFILPCSMSPPVPCPLFLRVPCLLPPHPVFHVSSGPMPAVHTHTRTMPARPVLPASCPSLPLLVHAVLDVMTLTI
ncbi:hypothetical protein CERSUDRAFT_118286 [Gelatoporia subvermispora B]|uniref:Uncharacterized protein n=1 Tax=Ceriporiopsis subvermispora (strain B) TaxID=914234 RepID=M2PC49_CERS8|nr:hypothetical protein CERSUDRAFT_118286 [Gelatoporia subvermispora B]